ncbi:MAG: secondary thiamine-phosphate synthase enzyme YjbQ [Dehalococcoidia bacterium]|nr:secondary thiamine-phosphate synthase enzyme YjbQ [Dehalococcoidia bacterium]
MHSDKARVLSAVEAGRISVLNGTSPGGLTTGPGYRIFSKIVQVESTDAPELIDFTDTVKQLVAESGVMQGQVSVYSTHTTFSVMINENEPLLLQDMEHFLERCAPKDAYYGHNDFELRTVSMRPNECPNGHAHCQHMILGTSEIVPVIDGNLLLGEFQRVLLVELDEPKPRQVAVQVMGL